MSVTFSQSGDAKNVASTFFNTVTNFSGLDGNSYNWLSDNGNSAVTVTTDGASTANVTGAWIQGVFSAPFPVAAWAFVGYAISPNNGGSASFVPVYLMGSNDGSSFMNISMSLLATTGFQDSVSTPGPCSTESGLGFCAYFNSTLSFANQPLFDFYRVVAPNPNYNYAVTLFSLVQIGSPPPSPPQSSYPSPPPPPFPPAPANKTLFWPMDNSLTDVVQGIAPSALYSARVRSLSLARGGSLFPHLVSNADASPPPPSHTQCS